MRKPTAVNVFFQEVKMRANLYPRIRRHPPLFVFLIKKVFWLLLDRFFDSRIRCHIARVIRDPNPRIN